MASLTKKQKQLLESIIEANNKNEYPYLTKSAVAALVAGGFVETNDAEPDAAGAVMARATQQGIEAMSEVQTESTGAAPAATKASFAIADAIAIPTAKRGGRTGETYPFDALQPNQSFFVANESVKSKNAAKSIASTVTSANERYSEVVEGQTRTNRKGNTVPLRTNTREFIVRAVADGAAWGQPGVAGAGVWRTK